MSDRVTPWMEWMFEQPYSNTHYLNEMVLNEFNICAELKTKIANEL